MHTHSRGRFAFISNRIRILLIRLQYVLLRIIFIANKLRKSLTKKNQKSTIGKVNIGNQWTTPTHRSGWGFAIDALMPLHNPRGVILDAFLDKTFGWDRPSSLRMKKIPFKAPWVGFLHRPQGLPDWYEPERSLRHFLEEPLWIESMHHCRGLFCLSEYVAAWLRERVNVPVSALIHPTEMPLECFSMEKYVKNPQKKIVHIGWCLRRMHSLFELNSGPHEKVLVSAPMWERGMSIEAPHVDYKGPVGRVTVLPFQSKKRYDKLLSENIAFIHLYDSSANNAIIECIVRNTPLLVNPLPAVREYLGDGYPFYFESLEEATEKLSSERLIAETYAYLQTLPKNVFSQEFFRESFVASTVYRNLPTPA